MRARPFFLAALLAAGVACGSPLSPPDESPFGVQPGEPNETPLGPLPAPHACGVRIKELSVYQAVKVRLLDEGVPVALTAPLIEKRRALFRAYFGLGIAAVPGNARARLRLDNSTGTHRVDGEAYVGQESVEGRLDTTFNFDVPAALMTGDLKVSVELELGNQCSGGGRKSYPEGGVLALPLRNTGTIKITLVPIAYNGDGSGRLPDFSDNQLNNYYQAILAMYPVGDVELTIRGAVSTTIRLSSGNGWGQLLDSLRLTRDSDGAGRDVYYYALVSPAASFNSYCQGACIAGLSYLADAPSASRQVGAGVGFTGRISAETLVHELGHQHGRIHAPCMVGNDADPRYPDKNARTIVWGYDFRTSRLMSPTEHADMMSYCEPIWISDYTYSALADRRSAVLALGAAARVINPAAAGAAPRGFRTLLTGEAEPIWGHPLAELDTTGTAETAQALDADGKVVANVTVYRHAYGHAGQNNQARYDIPPPAPGWSAIAVRGQRPIRYLDPTRVPRLVPLAADRLDAPKPGIVK